VFGYASFKKALMMLYSGRWGKAMMSERAEYERKEATKDDVELEQINSEDEDYISAPPKYQIATYPADFTLEVLHSKWKSGDIEIPPFQRKFVWKIGQSSKLIESFLCGLPVPAIYLYTERKSQKFLVIDGQQRLKSIFYFFEGFFGEETGKKRLVFRMEGLSDKSEWLGKSFDDFDDADKRRLRNSVLRSFVVQQLDPNDDTSIYHIFERLNTGGTLLTNQEVRNCVYGGKLNKLLMELNSNGNWRLILGRSKPDTRLKDIELMLRFFAFYNSFRRYEKPLKDFLSKYMSRNRNPPDEYLEELRSTFEKTCGAVVSALGERPFHVRAGLNSAVYDSVTVAFARNLNRVPNDIRKKYVRLKDDERFLMSTTDHTTDVEAIRERFRLASSVLFGEKLNATR
jgi:uncharacterized protein with ParB-like and HNH nuclease domain